MTETATTAQATPVPTVPTRAEVLERLRSALEAEMAGAQMCRDHPDEDHGAKVLANFERLARCTRAAIVLIQGALP